MANLKTLLQKTQLYLTAASKTLIHNHKKKLIAAILLLVGGYIIKKKMTMSHLITIIDCLSKLVQYLPLPDSPKLREMAVYEHPEPVPLRAIMAAMKVQDIKGRMTRKEATWEDLKNSIFTGTALTLILYNVNSFYFLVQTKYNEQFKSLHALEPFEQAMYSLRKSFTDQIPRIFAELQVTLQHQMDSIELQKTYDLQQLGEIFQRLTSCALSRRFNVKEEKGRGALRKADKQALNLFSSIYEQQQEKKPPLLMRAASGLFSLLAGSLKVWEWFPQAKQEITCERYQFIRRSYYMSALKAEVEGVRWPNETARGLFELVHEEAICMLLSLNFSILLKEHIRYNQYVLLNRIRLWMVSARNSTPIIARLLPFLLKILNQEFFKDEVYKLRQKYHEKELKRSIRQIAFVQPEGEAQMQPQQGENTLEEAILLQIEMKKAYQYLEREFQLKYFNERSGFVHRPKRQEPQGGDSREVQKMLNMFSGSEVLNQHQ